MLSALQPTPWYRLLKWGDYLIYTLITIIAVGLFLQGPLFMRPVTGGEGQVMVNGQIFRIIGPQEMSGTGQFTIEANGYHYTAEFANGQIRISQADCPDKVCVKTGWVSRQGEVAACVPGNLILSVEPGPNGTTGNSANGSSDNTVDVVLK